MSQMFCAFFSSVNYNLFVICIISFIASSIATIEVILIVARHRILIILKVFNSVIPMCFTF